jgi:protein-L-isoaspartate(D-aspartate) O-methyltransferase
VKTIDFLAARKAMVDGQLRTNAITDPRVVDAFEAVAREDFVSEHSRSVAYTDRPVPLVDGRTLNPPLATARMINELQITSRDEVLIIGAATGYTAAVVARLAGRVVGVESDAAMSAHAARVFERVDMVNCVTGDLSTGAPDQGPYSVILIDGAVEFIPQSLTDQLSDNGRLAAFVFENGVARLVTGKKTGGAFGTFPLIEMEACRLPGFAKPKAFVF